MEIITHKKNPLLLNSFYIVVALVCVLGAVLIYALLSGVIRSNVYINNTYVGGLTKAQAHQAIVSEVAKKSIGPVKVVVEGKSYPINPNAINLSPDINSAVNNAWSIGRSPNPFRSLSQLMRLPFTTISIPLAFTFDENELRTEIGDIAYQVDKPKKDIRLSIKGASVEILSDTHIGYELDQHQVYTAVVAAITDHTFMTPSLTLQRSDPTVDYASAESAKDKALNMLKQPLKLTYNQYTFSIDPTRIGAWIQDTPKNTTLNVELDTAAISTYVTTIAEDLNAESQAPKVMVSNGRVTEFVAPRAGRRLDQTATVALISEALTKRRDGQTDILELALPVTVEKPIVSDAASELGIVELIGTATTPFTGSPKNRIANIKNGTKFLSGQLIKPGEEFSVLNALGTIDNTTGYLPELVIKENRTVPEYGGGLCQVSTTLFRAVMNTGLPITARQNHSYRVTYYEKDASGKYIGPGLDATIYKPWPDFKFINDTKATILIQGYVIGDKLTFDLYGTKDGRVAKIDGPHKLSDTPAGDPIYIETDTIPPGETKRVETAHNGGSAIATYTITYPDGTIKESVYKSFYRNWPAQYLVGVDPAKLANQTSTTPLTQ